MYTDVSDARALANQIKDYWKQKGHNIKMVIECEEHKNVDGELLNIYTVKSNMVNGLPA